MDVVALQREGKWDCERNDESKGRGRENITGSEK
jgi:hypothetical protein